MKKQLTTNEELMKTSRVGVKGFKAVTFIPIGTKTDMSVIIIKNKQKFELTRFIFKRC